MSKKDISAYREQVNEAVEDGGGCIETWQAVDEMRDEQSEPNRRSFLQRLGVTIGAIPLAGATVAGATEVTGGTHDEPDVQTEPLRGRERTRAIRSAYFDQQFWYTYRRLSSVSLNDITAVSFRIEDNHGVDEGRIVTFGDVEDGDPYIRYYDSDIFPSGTSVYGGTADGPGFHAIDGDNKTEIHAQNDTARTLAERVKAGRAVTQVHIDPTQFRSEDAVLFAVDDEQNILNIPVEENGEIIDRVVVMFDEPTELDDGSAQIVVASEHVTTQGHVVCGPFGVVCTDYCKVLCMGLAAGAGAGCLAKCAGTIAGIPISPGCAAICAGVVGGTCHATCMRHAH